MRGPIESGQNSISHRLRGDDSRRQLLPSTNISNNV